MDRILKDFKSTDFMAANNIAILCNAGEMPEYTYTRIKNRKPPDFKYIDSLEYLKEFREVEIDRMWAW